MALDLKTYRETLATRTAQAAADRARFDRAASLQRATSPEERALALLERLETYPDLADAVATATGADVGALVAYHSANVAQAARGGSERTECLDSRSRTERGSVPVQRTMGRGTDADHYPLLDGAPVGTPESLDGFRAERAAVASDVAWAARNAYAETEEPMSRKQRENARKKAARARKVAP